jgi:thiopeptide-type bacteriocin biosynthesis protein
MTHQPETKSRRDFSDAGFFVLRTPALPADDFLNWTNGMQASRLGKMPASPDEIESAWHDDVQMLRDRLKRLVDRPEISHALFVASPTLQSGIELWKVAPDSKKGLQAERALVRYFTRMCTRPTPFGLFAGVSLGHVTKSVIEHPGLHLQTRQFYRPSTRLDYDYLFSLTDALERDRTISRQLRYWPNTSLHKAGNSWNYVEARLIDDGPWRSHHLVKVESDTYVDAVLSRARTSKGATVSEIISVLLEMDPDLVEADAEIYIQELIDNKLLVSSLSPLVTGPLPLDDIIAQLELIPSTADVAVTLSAVREQLAALEHRGLCANAAEYARIKSMLGRLPATMHADRIYQVDMIKPSLRAALTPSILDTVLEAVDVLCRFPGDEEPESLAAFKKAFVDRYEGALVPFLDVLDEESGIGFGQPSSYESTAIQGLSLENRLLPGQFDRFAPVHEFLLDQIMSCYHEGSTEIRLAPSDMPSFRVDSARLPASFCMNIELVAPSCRALQAGDFQILVNATYGPDGARSLARFCHAEPQLATAVREYLRAEQLNEPDAIMAEVVHLPEGRVGNVLSRPLLRQYELVYLGRSGAEPDYQIPASDLLVTVDEYDEICLYSVNLGRRVIPRLTTAHGFFMPSQAPVYRFLGWLQHQHGVMAPRFSWGPLASLSFLPRMTVGNVVIAQARWRLKQNEIKRLSDQVGCRRFAVVQELRKLRSLPRFIEFEQSDHTLFVDLDNALSVDAFVHVLNRVQDAIVREVFPGPENLCVTSEEGRFWHELEIPLIRRSPSAATRHPKHEDASAVIPPRAHVSVRSFIPGSDWLYVKLYGGSATLDQILLSHVRPLIDTAVEDGCISRWFFVRYADPRQHLRVRFNGDPTHLRRNLLPLISARFQPLIESGLIWKLQFDTYIREVERYGGALGIVASEDIFHADSNAVLELLGAIDPADDLDVRWRVAMLSVDRLLTDCGLNRDERLLTARQLLEHQNARFRLGKFEKKVLGDRFRNERPSLEEVLGSHTAKERIWQMARDVLEQRSVLIAHAAERLRSLQSCGRLLTSLPALAGSYVHMHVNRMMRAAANEHELVLYDFLVRLYESDAAQSRLANSNVLGGIIG